MRSFALIIMAAIVLGLVACGTESTSGEREWKVSTNPPAGGGIEKATQTAQARPTLAPVNLLTTKIAPLWVELSDGEFFMTVRANPYFDVRELELMVFVDGVMHCNAHTIYEDDGWRELSCAAYERSHRDVQRVSAQSPRGDLRCEKNIQSTGRATVFACGWR